MPVEQAGEPGLPPRAALVVERVTDGPQFGGGHATDLPGNSFHSRPSSRRPAVFLPTFCPMATGKAPSSRDRIMSAPMRQMRPCVSKQTAGGFIPPIHPDALFTHTSKFQNPVG